MIITKIRVVATTGGMERMHSVREDDKGTSAQLF